jgi:signal transduction histidine kinase
VRCIRRGCIGSVARERAYENFVEQVIEAQEIERRRLAGDIHDGISQRLIALSYRLDAASRAVGGDPTAVGEQLVKAHELVELTLEEARAAIGGLRPPVLDDLGLAGGQASLARSMPQIDLEVEPADTRVPEHIEIAQVSTGWAIRRRCPRGINLAEVNAARSPAAPGAPTVGCGGG